MRITDERLRSLLEERARILEQCHASLLRLRQAQARMRSAVCAGREALGGASGPPGTAEADRRDGAAKE